MSAPTNNDVVLLVHDAIDVGALMQFVRADEDGAVVTFDGFVRNESHGRSTLYLDYEAYESMALAKMSEIATQARAKYAIHRVAIAHRVGRLVIGETSVFKKEYFEDGAIWADGELPPVPTTTPGTMSAASPSAMPATTLAAATAATPMKTSAAAPPPKAAATPASAPATASSTAPAATPAAKPAS
jgi:molybdopterin synthase catalytic subunit